MTTSVNTLKTCFKCGQEKGLSEFYRHPKMSDGHLNKCVECTRKDVVENRMKRIEYYREYDRGRGYRPGPDFKVKARKATRALQRHPCLVCGDLKTEAHHPNYARPLDVEWLCKKHHSEVHRKYS